MKIINLNRSASETGNIQRLLGQFSEHTPARKTDERAEEAILTRFSNALDNRYVLIRNLPVQGTNDRFPPILIGPLGIVLLNLSSAEGFFKAKEDSWWEMSESTHGYSPGRPNLIKQSQEYAQKLAGLLEKHGKSHPDILPVLILVNPGVHVESSNPAIRIVLVDGVENLIGGILNSEEVLGPTEISNLSGFLEVTTDPAKAIPVGEGEDFFGRDLLEPEKKPGFSLPKFNLPTKLSLSAIEEKLQFTPKQWLILEVLMVLVILVLLGGIIYIILIY
jgi:hypothetical protein